LSQLVHELRVRFAECDPQGIVFNSRYLEYFDVGLTELWREALGGYDEPMKAEGVDLVVAEAGVRFHSSLRFDDLFEIRATISRLGTTSLTTAFVLLRGDERIATGELRHVFVDREGAEKTTIPESIRRGLEPYAEDGTRSSS
jgi:acyl-CoA thioester hydrolase